MFAGVGGRPAKGLSATRAGAWRAVSRTGEPALVHGVLLLPGETIEMRRIGADVRALLGLRSPLATEEGRKRPTGTTMQKFECPHCHERTIPGWRKCSSGGLTGFRRRGGAICWVIEAKESWTTTKTMLRIVGSFPIHGHHHLTAEGAYGAVYFR